MHYHILTSGFRTRCCLRIHNVWNHVHVVIEKSAGLIVAHRLQENLGFRESIELQWIETSGDKDGASIDRGEKCRNVDAIGVRRLFVDIVED